AQESWKGHRHGRARQGDARGGVGLFRRSRGLDHR
ncbi:MAG: hypothetical protein AVDCRST_MAG19-2834, partial [uncultured Thermomicrobiales bacterium]